jgi:TetR/AcrR family transcriptional repressor of nem operon
MRISRSSLYETFGDKQALFNEAMDCYLECVAAKRLYQLKKAGTARLGIEAYFEDQIRMAHDKRYPNGCFFANVSTALATADSKTAGVVQRAADSLEKEFYDLLKKGQAAGEISRKKDAAELARALLALAYGMNILAQVKKDKKWLGAMLKPVLKLLD